MTYKEAYERFTEVQCQVVEDGRKRLVDKLEVCKRAVLSLPAAPPAPKGIFARLLQADYDRVLSARKRITQACDAARVELERFDAERSGGDVSQADLPEIWKRFGAAAQAIGAAFVAETKRLDQKKQHHEDTLAELNRLNSETGLRFVFVRPDDPLRPREKQRAMLVGPLKIADVVYAQVTDDEGDSFKLFPWVEEMKDFYHREGWFWYDDNHGFKFAPVMAAKPPIAPKSAPRIRPNPCNENRDDRDLGR